MDLIITATADELAQALRYFREQPADERRLAMTKGEGSCAKRCITSAEGRPT